MLSIRPLSLTRTLSRCLYNVPRAAVSISATRTALSAGAGTKGGDPNIEWERRSKLSLDALRKPPTPYTGRTVKVSAQGIAKAYTRLQIILARNNVVKELRMHERHEKKGYKRRRIKRERWRRLFAAEVRKKVQLVQAIRIRGA